MLYQTMPHIARLMPANFFRGISSPNSRHPPVRMMTVCKHQRQLSQRVLRQMLSCTPTREANSHLYVANHVVGKRRCGPNNQECAEGD